jgi:hypothetical protein
MHRTPRPGLRCPAVAGRVLGCHERGEPTYKQRPMLRPASKMNRRKSRDPGRLDGPLKSCQAGRSSFKGHRRPSIPSQLNTLHAIDTIPNSQSFLRCGHSSDNSLACAKILPGLKVSGLLSAVLGVRYMNDTLAGGVRHAIQPRRISPSRFAVGTKFLSAAGPVPWFNLTPARYHWELITCAA